MLQSWHFRKYSVYSTTGCDHCDLTWHTCLWLCETGALNMNKTEWSWLFFTTLLQTITVNKKPCVNPTGKVKNFWDKYSLLLELNHFYLTPLSFLCVDLEVQHENPELDINIGLRVPVRQCRCSDWITILWLKSSLNRIQWGRSCEKWNWGKLEFARSV